MKIKKSEVLKIAGTIERINKASERTPFNLPYKINYALQRTLVKLDPDRRAINKAVDDINKEIREKANAIHKEYADRTKDEKGNDVPLVRDGNYICTKRESERTIEIEKHNAKTEKRFQELNEWLESEIEVEVFRFEVSKEDEARMEKLDGYLYGILPLVI